MKYPWVHDDLLAKPGVTSNVQTSWRWVRYYVADKMFAAVCLEEENRPYYITVKLPPEESELLRAQYEDILPGYYCNKLHWSSIRADGAVPEELVRAILDHSYQTGFRALTKRRQKEIEALTTEGSEQP